MTTGLQRTARPITDSEFRQVQDMLWQLNEWFMSRDGTRTDAVAEAFNVQHKTLREAVAQQAVRHG